MKLSFHKVYNKNIHKTRWQAGGFFKTMKRLKCCAGPPRWFSDFASCRSFFHAPGQRGRRPTHGGRQRDGLFARHGYCKVSFHLVLNHDAAVLFLFWIAWTHSASAAHLLFFPAAHACDSLPSRCLGCIGTTTFCSILEALPREVTSSTVRARAIGGLCSSESRARSKGHAKWSCSREASHLSKPGSTLLPGKWLSRNGTGCDIGTNQCLQPCGNHSVCSESLCEAFAFLCYLSVPSLLGLLLLGLHLTGRRWNFGGCSNLTPMSGVFALTPMKRDTGIM